MFKYGDWLSDHPSVLSQFVYERHKLSLQEGVLYKACTHFEDVIDTTALAHPCSAMGSSPPPPAPLSWLSFSIRTLLLVSVFGSDTL